MPLSDPPAQGPFATDSLRDGVHDDERVADVRARLNAAWHASELAPEKARAKLDAQGKIYVRDRIALLFDEGSFVEDGRYANAAVNPFRA